MGYNPTFINHPESGRSFISKGFLKEAKVIANKNVAIFKDANGVVYSTANAPDPSLSVYPANGQIIVDDISNTTPKTIRGTFWFNAYTADGLNYINFNEGVFFNIPLIGGLEIITN